MKYANRCIRQKFDYYERRRIPYVVYTQEQNYRSILDISFYRTADNRVPLHLYVTVSLPERENRFDLI